MADLWQSQLYECSFGGIRLDVQGTDDANGRVLATFQIPHRDGAPVRDMGAEPRVTKCKAIFFQLDATDDPRDRFRRFKALVDKGAAATFVHPISGSMRAYVGEFGWSAASEPRDTIVADLTFHEDSDVPASFAAGPGSTARVGSAEVMADAADSVAAITAYNTGRSTADQVSLAIVDESAALATAWEADDSLGANEVDAQLGSASVRLQDAIDALELADDIDLYEVLVAMTRLHATLRRAAISALQDSPKMFEITVVSSAPLYAIASRTYGGAEAHVRFDQLIKLNRIPNPGRVEAGTRLRAVQPSAPARFGSPKARG